MSTLDALSGDWPAALPCPFSGPHRAVVLDVHDGDTIAVIALLPFDVRVEVKVRLYGINAPELSKPGGVEARDRLRDYLPAGTPVRITTLLSTRGEATRSFVRYVAEVEAIGLAVARPYDVASAMVRDGKATWVSRDMRPLKNPPPPIARWVEGSTK